MALGIIDFITGFGPVLAAGVEGTGSYGAELSRVLAREGMHVVEVMRPNRQARRLQGKSDPLDAYQAAESVLAGRAATTPKSRDGAVESGAETARCPLPAPAPGTGADRCRTRRHPHSPRTVAV